MANGKPGDHWWTDITAHGLPTFSPEIDALIQGFDARVRASGEPNNAWRHPVRRRVEVVVDGVLSRIGYGALAARGETVGMEYTKLSPEELTLLHAELTELREALAST